MQIRWLPLGVLLLAGCASSVYREPTARAADWGVYGGDAGGQRYSSLRQIDRSNVGQLKQAWRFDVAETGDPETNPLIVAGVMYAYTPSLKVVAINAQDGREIWRYDPGLKTGQPSRGFSFWRDGSSKRIFAGVMNYLIALDPDTGHLITTFGDAGRIDLRKGLGGDYTKHFVALTSPGVIYKDLIIVGFRTMETHPAPAGDVRAFDVRTGEVRWTFHTIPRPGEAGYETWPDGAWQSAGAANNWAGMTLDRARGIVFVPTGSAVSDFYGADRLGDDLYADSLVALDASSGRRLWHFQAVHHDILDRDLPTAPSLLSVVRNGKRVDVVAQPTKQGFLFVLERETGRPVFPVNEAPSPRSEVPGEMASKTQPVAEIPAPFARQRLDESLLTNRNEKVHEWALEQLRQMRNEGPFTPAGVDRPSIVFPGFDGGAEWGGAAVDPQHGIIYINANDVAWSAQLTDQLAKGGPAERLYQRVCASCHGPDRRGSPPAFPSLVDVDQRLSAEEIISIVSNGRGRMPAFGAMPSSMLEAAVVFASTGHEPPDQSGNKEMSFPIDLQDARAAYQFTGYKKFLDPEGYPAVAPPWGTLNAIDLNTGRYLWKLPLGEYPELTRQGLPPTGSENYGGPIVTAGGLVFIGATIYDRKFRAFDAASGTLLWETELPYAGTATPATYMAGGKQFVVIATNNNRNRAAAQGSSYVAFSLP